MTSDELAAVRIEPARAARDRGKDLTDVVRAVREFAAAARSASMPPERMLANLGAVLNDGAARGTGDWWHAVLRDRFIREAIEAYYAIDLRLRARSDAHGEDAGRPDEDA